MDRGNPDRWTYGLAVATVAVFFERGRFRRGDCDHLLLRPRRPRRRRSRCQYLRAAAGELDLTAGDVADVAVTDLVPTAPTAWPRLSPPAGQRPRDRRRGDGDPYRPPRADLHRTGEASCVPPVTAPRPSRSSRLCWLTWRFARPRPVRSASAATRRISPSSIASADSTTASSLEPGALRRGDPGAGLRYFRSSWSDRLTLAWNLNLKVPAPPIGSHMWIDATTGDLVGKVYWTAEVDATYSVFASPRSRPGTDRAPPKSIPTSLAEQARRPAPAPTAGTTSTACSAARPT